MPMVVSMPWPGSTIVSTGSGSSFVWIDSMMVAKLLPGNFVAPGPPGPSVSPLNS